MNSPHKLKLALFITGITLIAGSMLLPSTAMRTFAGPPLIITGSPTIPPPVTATTETAVFYADPYVLKSTNSGMAMPGETIEFTLVAGNRGNVNAVNVQVRDTLASYLDLVSVTASPRGTVIQSGNSFIVDIGDIAPAELITIQVTVRVNDTARPGECINVGTLNTTSAGDNPDNNVSVTTCLIGQIAPPPTGADLSNLPMTLITVGTVLIVASLFIRKRKTA
jgi:uncharacterized repeat protein (TIGR01451 family)